MTPSPSIAVLGLGLIGGSLLRRLADRDAVGYDADEATRVAAQGAGLRVTGSVAEAVADRDLIVVAVPLPAVGDLLADVDESAGPHALLTDVVSVMAPVQALAAERITRLRLVAGHPMAGTERSGFAASDPRLFDGAAWPLALEPGTDVAGWLAVADLVTAIGARVVPCTAAGHDAAVALVSHLPHVLAASLAAAAAGDPLARTLAAGSFRDATRVAATRPELTAAMSEANAGALLAALDDARHRITDAAARLVDGRGLTEFFTTAYEMRSRWPDRSTVDVEIDAGADDLRARLLELGGAGGYVVAVDDALRCRRPG
jgi:prephenate dehydrogenase